MLTVLTYLWQDPEFSQHHGFAYSVDDVLLLRSMVDRNLSVPHDYLCVTDDTEQFAGTGIRAIPLPEKNRIPGRIYEPLYTFSADLADHAERILKLDLDCVVVDSLNPLVDRDEDIVLWRNPRRAPWNDRPHPTIAYYNGSIQLLTAGAYAHVWDDFDPAGAMPQWCGDQDWYSHVLGPDMPYWDTSHGVWRYWRHKRNTQIGFSGELPEGARLVFFPGGGKPWDRQIIQDSKWIAQHRL